MNEIEVTIKIPAPPEGWVYDGYRKCKPDEMCYSNSDGWHVHWWAETYHCYPVAVKVQPPWEPPPEIVAAVLLVHGPGWIAKDSSRVCKWHQMKPEPSVGTWWSNGCETRLHRVFVPNDIGWKNACFKIGEPQQ